MCPSPLDFPPPYSTAPSPTPFKRPPLTFDGGKYNRRRGICSDRTQRKDGLLISFCLSDLATDCELRRILWSTPNNPYPQPDREPPSRHAPNRCTILWVYCGSGGVEPCGLVAARPLRGAGCWNAHAFSIFRLPREDPFRQPTFPGPSFSPNRVGHSAVSHGRQ